MSKRDGRGLANSIFNICYLISINNSDIYSHVFITLCICTYVCVWKDLPANFFVVAFRSRETEAGVLTGPQTQTKVNIFSALVYLTVY